MRWNTFHYPVLLILAASLTCATESRAALEVAGLTVTPHLCSRVMCYRHPPDPDMGILGHVFLRNTGSTTIRINDSLPVHFGGFSPSQLLDLGEWTWHDTPCARPGQPLELPPGALTVWTFNSRGTNWGVGTRALLSIGPPDGVAPTHTELRFTEPRVWLSAVTFLGPTNAISADSLIFHVANQTDDLLRIISCRLWLPGTNHAWRALLPREPITRLECFPSDGTIPPGDRGGARVLTGPLPLTYIAVEVRLSDPSGKPQLLWAFLRVKRETFDISGGWVASKLGTSNTLQSEAYLKTLRRVHINTAHIADVPGYTDQDGPAGLYTRYPLKYFNKLQPFDRYDTEAMLPRIHAVEFLGEPQYGGGRPVPPQEVWQKLAPYQPTRLPTTVTHSEERIWRYYAGLSDYPHYDAYRITAPAADAWSKYDRWNGQTIRWGAPLETIGELTRSLRELNRPRPIAYWSQGPNEGWEGLGGRQRTSPTPDELRAQAYHALASRITSLYWFNLSLKSLLKFPDLIDPITRVGREIRMLEEFYLEGDAFSHETVRRDDNPYWDLDVIAGPRGALLFALDLDYKPDPQQKLFRFGPPRESHFHFPLPTYAHAPAQVFRVDADGVCPVNYAAKDGALEISDRVSRLAIYVAATSAGERDRLEARRAALVAEENALGFDPGRNAADLEVLKRVLAPIRD